MAESPTTRSLKLLRKRGYRCEVVERRIPFNFVTKDLFGFIDIIAILGTQTLAVQTTSASNVSSRVKKIADSDSVADVRMAGWSIHVHGWKKVKNRWQCREVDVS